MAQTCVDAHVSLQGPGVSKCSLAVHTDERLLTTVHTQVSLQVACEKTMEAH